jgi:hypothetical protein
VCLDFNWPSKWKFILQILLSLSSNEHRIPILQMAASIHSLYCQSCNSPYDSLEPFVISAYWINWSEPESLSSHCRFMSTKVERSRLAEVLIDFTERYIHLQIILMSFYGLSGLDIYDTEFPWWLQESGATLKKSKKKTSAKKEGKELNIWCNTSFPARSTLSYIFDRIL